MRSSITVAIAASLFAAACSNSEPGVKIPRYLGEPNADDEALVGTLVIENSCLYVRTESGELVLTAFPTEFTEWNGGRQVLNLSGDDVPPGKVFLFGGSAMDLSRAGSVRWSTPPDRLCAEGQRSVWLSGERATPIEDVPNLDNHPSPPP